ncbi:MAG: hypothetical protein J0I66_12520 [Microbacterium sp.]|nr:hypothetical protein [Microbacterium sp.]
MAGTIDLRILMFAGGLILFIAVVLLVSGVYDMLTQWRPSAQRSIHSGGTTKPMMNGKTSSPSKIGNGSGTTPSWNRRCAQAPRSFGVDGAGNVWFTSNAGRQVSEIPAASVPTP